MKHGRGGHEAEGEEEKAVSHRCAIIYDRRTLRASRYAGRMPGKRKTEVEPWLRGAIGGVPQHLMPVAHSFAQVREDLAHWADGIRDEDVWRSISGLPPLGFHLRHIAGSVDRLATYAVGEPLSEEQLAFLRRESEPGEGLPQLLAEVDHALAAAEVRLAAISANALHEARTIGRKQLPSTVYGLLVHIAEHTQRHLGQAITTACLLHSQANTASGTH